MLDWDLKIEIGRRKEKGLTRPKNSIIGEYDAKGITNA